jgi:hypothetical protein
VTYATDHWTASTWGRLDEDGGKDGPPWVWQVWSVRTDQGRIGFVVLGLDALPDAVIAAAEGLVRAVAP